MSQSVKLVQSWQKGHQIKVQEYRSHIFVSTLDSYVFVGSGKSYKKGWFQYFCGFSGNENIR